MKNQKVTADKTKDAILKAARKLFMDRGFTATSMSQIAESADVNQSLISHHFENKQGVWDKVKEQIAGAETLMKTLNPTPSTLKEFLVEAIQSRLSLYENSPDLYRLVSWERLEKTVVKKAFVDAATHPMVQNWLRPIEYLLKQGKIKTGLSPQMIFIWVLMSVNGIIMDELHYFKNNPMFKAAYIEMITDGLLKGLAP